jgi:hypothetical protein
MRAFRVSFASKTSKWIIEIAKLNFAFFTLWTPAKIFVVDEYGYRGYEVMTFDKADEAYKYIEETGLNKLYKDVTSSMPWEQARPEWENIQSTNKHAELAKHLREVITKDRSK